MNKEEFLAFSLPYGLKGIVKGKENLCGSFIYKLYSCNCETNVVELVGETNFKTDKFIPALHPLYYLTKEIEHNGEKFIPIIELAKISFEVCSDLEIKVKSKDKISGCMFIDDDDDVIVFVYNYETKSFCAHRHSSKQFLNVHYQLKMIQKLIEWKFDVAGLIEKNEAIDVNTLEVNPYK